MSEPGPKPTVACWRPWTGENGVGHQDRRELTEFELKGVGPADPQWIAPLSGRWWVEAMDGTRVGMGPGDLSLGEDQNCVADAEGRKGPKSGTIGDQPAVLMTVQLHVPPIRQPCHLK